MDKTVLLVEDDLTWGELLINVFEHRGYKVAWFVRAQLGHNGKLLFTDADGKKAPLSPVPYTLAMVDGRLRSSELSGWDVVPHLVSAGNKVVAISGDRHFNQRMMIAGAYMAVPKYDLFSAVLNGTLRID